jgi:GTPase SAR1 family protein
MERLLAALNDTDFQWTSHIDSIWRDALTDIPELQASARQRLSARLSSLERSSDPGSPLGVPLLGTGGAGKTHLLSAVRREAFQRGQYFVLVDMTDVREFWETVLLGYLRSLDQQHEGVTQFTRLVGGLVTKLGAGMPSLAELAAARPPRLINRCNQLIQGLAREHRAEAREHQDVLRALVLVASDDFEIQEHGYQWLQGNGIVESEAFVHGFLETQKKPEQIVRGLSWLMSLHAPTVLALDQLDAIVAEHNLASAASKDGELNPRQLASLAIIQGIAGGLSALRDVTRRTLIIVSSLEATWTILDVRAQVTMKDRFEQTLLLQPIRDADSIRQLIERRLGTSYAQHGVTPEYPSYPFSPAFFRERIGLLPREVLKACNEHRYACATAGKVFEIGDTQPLLPPRDDFADVDLEFESAMHRASVVDVIERQDEDVLDKWMEAACDALIEENPLPDSLDALVDKDFLGSGSFEPLHARLRVVDRDANDREIHYAFRCLEKTNHIAFQSRLKAAITASGIDSDLEFRKLAVIRTRSLLKGSNSERLLQELLKRGGRVVVPTERELKVLAAVKELQSDPGRQARLHQWLRSRRPVSELPMFAEAVQHLFGRAAPPDDHDSRRPSPTANTARSAAGARQDAHAAGTGPSAADAKQDRQGTNGAASTVHWEPSPLSSAPTAVSLVNRSAEIVIGSRLIAGESGGSLAVPLDNMTKHTVVLAGAGSGKTVLVRRIVEGAALAGVPSIVIDGANDLSCLGDPWPAPPQSFTDTDSQQAAEYFAQTEVVVWSPGRERGNPLRLEPLPDFSAAAGDPDELNSLLDMARSSLEPITIGAKPDKVRQGVLSSALRYFALQGGGNLGRLISLLSELPPDANAGYEKGEKLARDAADRLRAETETNPLFRGDGKSLDPAVLLRSGTPGKVRVSVINLGGLPDLSAQQQFVNQLAMTLFSWIKKNPARGQSLQGLLVIDEARDFIPSGKSVPGKDSLIRLVAQARKYGLGIVFATQAPKSIDHNVIANCSTQFYGRQNSPAAIDTVKEQLSQRGNSGSDIAKLPRGVFYAFTEGLSAATKIQVPLCLSHHPPSPPDEDEVRLKAERSRALIATT